MGQPPGVVARLRSELAQEGIPAGISSLSRLRQWSHSAQLPDRGRIDYLSGMLEVRSLQEGRSRETPSAKGGEERFVELEGMPDLVVEIVSDGSASM